VGSPEAVRIEHGPVWAFARAVKDDSPLYASEQAAADAGFDGVPVPPTFTFVMTHEGAFPDLQPEETPPPPDAAETAALYSRPGLFLHGEQEFVYHRWPLVGEVLEGRTRTSSPFTREGTRRPMEFTLYETLWSDLEGEPVVSERITSIFLPEGPPGR
jgi:peroxisomal enoyl-CoA hydratase 2